MFFLFTVELREGQERNRSDDSVERRANFMTHRRQEFAACGQSFFKASRAFLDAFFQRPCVLLQSVLRFVQVPVRDAQPAVQGFGTFVQTPDSFGK